MYPLKQYIDNKRSAEISALRQRADRFELALVEVHRRTNLLIHQNTGCWRMSVEHDKRTVDVLTSNQSILEEALYHDKSFETNP